MYALGMHARPSPYAASAGWSSALPAAAAQRPGEAAPTAPQPRRPLPTLSHVFPVFQW